jgi:hypothetical protein
MGSIRMIAVSAVLTAGLFQAGAANAQNSDVQIVRGGQSASIIETREANVRVFRGTPAKKLAVTDRRMASTTPIEQVVTSGSKVWFVDHAAGELRMCRLAATTQVGEIRIDCHSRALPR